MALLHSKQLPIGWKAADFLLPGTDGREYSLMDFASFPALLVLFTCNHCPYAQASWPLIIEMASKHPDIGIVAINPNDAEHYPDDSFEEMKKRAVEWKIPFPYVRDEFQQTAREYNAQCTPDPYLFKRSDGEWELFYHGRVNDNWQHPDLVTEHSLEDAVIAVLKGEEPPAKQQPSMGCSIKWKKT